MARKVKTVKGALTGAKRLLEKVGWVKGRHWKKDNGKITGYCALGALMQTCDNSLYTKTIKVLYDALPSNWKRGELGHWTVINYNDAKSRRKAQVLNLFDRAIAASAKRRA